MPFQGCHLFLETIWCQQVVLMEQLHIFPMGSSDGLVPVGLCPEVPRIAMDADAGVVDSLEDRQAIVCGSIVKYQEFKVGVRLPQHRIDSFLQKAFAIEHRQANADQGSRGRLVFRGAV